MLKANEERTRQALNGPDFGTLLFCRLKQLGRGRCLNNARDYAFKKEKKNEKDKRKKAKGLLKRREKPSACCCFFSVSPPLFPEFLRLVFFSFNTNGSYS